MAGLPQNIQLLLIYSILLVSVGALAASFG